MESAPSPLRPRWSFLVGLFVLSLASPFLLSGFNWQSAPTTGTGVTWSINLGSLAIALALIGGLLKIVQVLASIHTDAINILIEHEMVIVDFCDRKNISINDLPTRPHRRIRTHGPISMRNPE